MADFACYIGIDYSGASFPNKELKGIRVYQAFGNQKPVEVCSVNKGYGKLWSRSTLYKWIETEIDKRLLIGIDHGLGYPLHYLKRYKISDWDKFLEHLETNHPGLRELSIDQVLAKHPLDSTFLKSPLALRLTDLWTTSATSVFRLQGQGCVGKSTLGGLAFLYLLRKAYRKDFQVWPFDDWTPDTNKSVIAEAYPSLYHRRYIYPEGTTRDQQDALAICKWLQERDQREQLQPYFSPALSADQKMQAQREGWILGVV